MKGPNPDVVGILERFESKLYLCDVLAREFLRGRPAFDKDDFVQEGRIVLWRCAQLFDPGKGVAFGAYATESLRKCFYNVLKERRDGQHSAPTVFLSLGEAITPDSELTVTDLVDAHIAEREMLNDREAERRNAILFDIQEMIRTLPSITPRERKILTLHFIEGIDQQEIARRQGRFKSQVCWDVKNALAKVRTAYFRSRPNLRESKTVTTVDRSRTATPRRNRPARPS